MSVRAATTIWGRLVAALGTPIETGEAGEAGDPALRVLAPTAEAILGAGVGALRAIGLTAARAEALLALSRAVAGRGVLGHEDAVRGAGCLTLPPSGKMDDLLKATAAAAA